MSTTITKPKARPLRPWLPLQMMRDEFEGFWSQLVGDRGQDWPAPLPPMDVAETANAIEVRMDLPGFKADEINVQLSHNVLTVVGSRDDEKKAEGETFHRIERRTGSFSRSFTLPAAVTEEKVDAHYGNGVLTISIQKVEDAKSRKIKVRT